VTTMTYDYEPAGTCPACGQPLTSKVRLFAVLGKTELQRMPAG